MSTTPRFTASGHRRGARRSAARLTGAVSAGTLAVSVAALISPALMQVTTRDLAQLRAGQGWRLVTPVLVQPDGWGQLAFNLIGIIVVGAALEHRTSRAAWAVTYALGGVGGVAAISAWHPADHGGGSSDAVAALIGALTVLLAAENREHDDPHRRRRWTVWPQIYCVFFAGYLTALDVGGVWWSIVAGNATIAAFVVARRALAPTSLSWACLSFVATAGVTMTAQQDGHGLGIISGAALASLILLWRRVVAPRRTECHLPTSHVR